VGTDANHPPALEAAITLFDQGSYLAAHELFEELWEETQGPESDFYKGLIQATIALHHFQEGNLEGAARLQAGHRRFLGSYLPAHRGIDVAAFLADMQRFLRPVLARTGGAEVPFVAAGAPRLRARESS
jgi:predicted metal-dependent hydrolase